MRENTPTIDLSFVTDLLRLPFPTIWSDYNEKKSRKYPESAQAK